MLRLPFDSELAKMLNKNIFETIYFAAMTASKELAREQGAYESFEGSPVSKEYSSFDMWGVEPSERWDWKSLKEEVKKLWSSQFPLARSYAYCVYIPDIGQQ